MLGPWYVGDSPTVDLVVDIDRDAAALELDDFASAAVLLYTPAGASVAWGSVPTIDIDADQVTIPPPSPSPFATPGTYQLFVRLSMADGKAETFMLDAIEVLALGTMPTVAVCRSYSPDLLDSWQDSEVQEELDAEAAAQRRVCRVGAAYPPDLRKALIRRVQRALAMRGLALAMPQGDPEAGPAILPAKDPEVRRLEAPHRKLVIG